MTVIDAVGGLPVGQVGIIVRDLERALESYSSRWGPGPWAGYVYGPSTVPRLTYRGESGRYSMRLALAGDRPRSSSSRPWRDRASITNGSTPDASASIM